MSVRHLQRIGHRRPMITKPVLAASTACVVDRRPAASEVVARYGALTKPDVSFLIGVTVSAGFYLGLPARPLDVPWLRMVHAVLGTVLVAGGAAAFNQWMEYTFDARMRRTARRPIAAGLIEPRHAALFAGALSLAGLTYLLMSVGAVPMLLAFGTLLSYLCLYTPAKRLTPMCTLIGAVPGAMPPVIGWASARGHIGVEALVLFAIVFLWQFPHFMSIAWLYRDDYDRAGYRVLPAAPARARFVSTYTLLPLFALLPLGLLPVVTHNAGVLYGFLSAILWVGFAYYGAAFEYHQSRAAARQLLMASILYLPALLVLMISSR
jgi:heme o synthase